MNLSTSHITDPKFKKIAQKIVSEMKRLQVPGVAIGIWHKGKEYADGFGVTNVEHPLPVTPDTLFQTGSISKTFRSEERRVGKEWRAGRCPGYCRRKR